MQLQEVVNEHVSAPLQSTLPLPGEMQTQIMPGPGAFSLRLSGVFSVCYAAPRPNPGRVSEWPFLNRTQGAWPHSLSY